VTWDARGGSREPVPAGVYFYRLEAGAQVQTRKLTIVR
jgi:hypothetical protein